MNNISRVILLLCCAVSLFFGACRGKVASKSSLGDGKEVEILDAKGFSITEHDGFRIIEVIDPWNDSTLLHRYILVDREAKLPSNLPAGDVVRVPVASTSCLYSVFVGMLDTLGVLPTVNSVAEERYIDNPKMKRMIADGKIGLLGEASAVNIERLIDCAPEIILASPFKNIGYGRMEKTGIPIVEVASYMESTPLARLEWLKFFAAFYGKEALADSIYSSIRQRYMDVRKLALSVSDKPTLFAEKKFGQVWNVPGGNSYMAAFFRDAGAKYLWDSNKVAGSIPLSFEAVYQKAEDADFWLIKYNKDADMTYSDIRGEYEPYAMFRAFKEHRIIYCNTKRVSYYEEGIMQPDVILADLVKIFHPELLPDHKQVYFQLLKP